MAQGKRFSPEFRQKAVRLYRVSERPYRAVAEELAVVPESTGSAERRPRQAVVRSAREEVRRCRVLAERRHAPLWDKRSHGRRFIAGGGIWTHFPRPARVPLRRGKVDFAVARTAGSGHRKISPPTGCDERAGLARRTEGDVDAPLVRVGRTTV